MAYLGTTLENQQPVFDEIYWPDQKAVVAQIGGPIAVSLPSRPLVQGIKNNALAPSYWEFSYRIGDGLTGPKGISFSDVVVRRTQAEGSTEDVFKLIEFADLWLVLSDNTVKLFDFQEAFANGKAQLITGTVGTRCDNQDSLYQCGFKLILLNDIPNGCLVRLELSAVFRGAKNDFDAGGVPMAMNVWPEISWTWFKDGAKKPVKRFSGSVKVTVNNKMQHGMHTGNENIASVFADSNTSMSDSGRPIMGITEPFSWGASRFKRLPLGWARVFDYARTNLPNEFEFVAVNGPFAGDKFEATVADIRDKMYPWPQGPFEVDPPPQTAIHVRKADRQGAYDNIHLHAKMDAPDRFGHQQIHAPFCGHSCVHMHWRWSSVSSNSSSSGPAWRYRGWRSSKEKGVPAKAFLQDDGPLVPPNQEVRVAICKNATQRAGQNILNTSQTLPVLNKIIYYAADVYGPNASDRQVICSHGLGWAFRYALQSESKVIEDLVHALRLMHLNEPADPTNQTEMSDFFEQVVYPDFRYIGLPFPDTDQIPQGDNAFNVTHGFFSLGTTLPDVKMEDF